MTNVGYATVSIIPSAKDFSKNLAAEIGRPMEQAAKESGAKSGQIFSSELRGKLQKGLTAAALGATGVLAGLAGLGKVAIDAASDFEQSDGSIDAIFQKSAGSVRKFRESSAVDLGLSANQYAEMASLIGAQLKNAGTPMDELAGKTQGLMKQGSDMAAVFGGTAADAVDAISSALKGERDPIEKYGISLNQSKIDAEAAALGYKKVGGALSTQAQQAATMSLINKQASATQGQWTKQIGTAAESQQVMTARLTDAAAKIGAAFLPAVVAISEKVSELATWIGNNSDTVTLWAGILAGVAGGIVIVAGVVKGVQLAIEAWTVATQLAAAAQKILSLVMAASPIGLVVTLIALLVAGLVFFFTQTELGQAIWAEFTRFLGEAWTNVSKVIGDALQWLGDFFSTIWAAIVFAVTTYIAAVKLVITTVVTAIVTAWRGFWGTISDVASTVFSAIVGFVRVYIEAVKLVITTVVSAIVTAWRTYWDILSSVVSAVWNTIKAFVNAGIDAVKVIIDTALKLIVAIFTGKWGDIPGIVQGALGKLGGIVRDLASNLLGILGKLASDVGSALGKVPEKVKQFFSDAGGWLLGAGRSLIEGFAKGIRDAVGTATGAVKGVVDAVAGFFPHSPAKEGPFSGKGWTPYSGLALVDGFAEGMADPRALRSVRSAALDIADAAQLDAAVGAGPTQAWSSPQLETSVLQALLSAGSSGDSLSLNYTQTGGQGLTAEQELLRAGRRLKQALRK